MIDIDGSVMEGGGQILRMAVAYSTLLGESVRVRNIRAGRPQPGLKAGHLRTLEAAVMISGGEIKGLKPRSREISYLPGSPRGGTYKFDVGTAGSLTLLLQCLSPIMAYADGTTKLHLTGGTDVQWSPTVDLMDNVIWRAYRTMGYMGEVTVKRRGFYPKGGGVLEVEAQPVKHLYAFQATKQKRGNIQGISLCGRLPMHVAERQGKAAGEVLSEAGYNSDIKVFETKETFSPGSSISLWSQEKSIFLGGSALGARGKPAERVGSEAAAQILEELRSGCCVDTFTADNLILWASLARGETRFTTSMVTQHTKTALWLAETFTDTETQVSLGPSGCHLISIQGVGLSR
jgi:RNA 3'-terminal phosphate cyclase (ATP)